MSRRAGGGLSCIRWGEGVVGQGGKWGLKPRTGQSPWWIQLQPGCPLEYFTHPMSCPPLRPSFSVVLEQLRAMRADLGGDTRPVPALDPSWHLKITVPTALR